MTGLPAGQFTPTPEDEAFWAAVAGGRLLLTRCEGCGVTTWYPRPFCPSCGGRDVTPVAAAGSGTVYSYTVVRRARGAFRDLAPYVVAYVELAEGPRILSNIVRCDPADVAIGMPVRLVFDDRQADGTIALFRFCPVAQTGSAVRRR